MSYQKYAPKTYKKFSSANLWSGIKATSYVNALLTGTKWGDLNPDNGGKTKLLYYLSKKGDIFKNNQIKIKPVNIINYEKNAIKNAMKAFSDVANISFQKTTNKMFLLLVVPCLSIHNLLKFSLLLLYVAQEVTLKAFPLDHTFVENKRQKPLGKKKVQEWLSKVPGQ